MKTYTPELEPVVLDRRRDSAALSADDFPPAQPARGAGVSWHGLLLDGARQRIEPLAGRVTRPEGLTRKDPEQALPPFVNQSPWDERKVLRRDRARPAETFASPEGISVLDDTSFPTQGKHSVGVPRQYGGALGKKADGQVAPSVHDVAPTGHDPLDLRRYLPDSWLADPKRLDQAGVPEEERRAVTEPASARERLDRVRGAGRPGGAVVTDAGDGASREFRAGVAARGLVSMAGVTGDFVVFPQEPTWDPPSPPGGGRPATRHRLATAGPRPVALSELARTVRLRQVTGREGTQGKLSARCAWLCVWPGQGWQEGACAHAAPGWLLIEEQADGERKFAVSDRPPDTRCQKAVRLRKSRWPVEQGDQQRNEELGLDHFEGRSWRGFHHHACLVFLADGLLTLERHRAAAAEKKKPVKKKSVHGPDAAGAPAGAAGAVSAPRPEPLSALPEAVTYTHTGLTEWY